MAEAGPSHSGTTSSAASVSPSSLSKQPAIQFSPEGSQSGSLRRDRSHTASPIGLGKPPILRNATVRPSPPSISSNRSEDGRRRVKSAEQPASSHRSRGSIDGNGAASRRSAIAGRKSSRRDRGSYGAGVADDANGVSMLSAFSDEYNLSHEDPQILEEVQRALKLKARREARLRALSVTSPPKDTSHVSEGASGSSFSGQASPSRAQYPLPPAAAHPADLSIESEIDFSPSTGTHNAHQHPIPTSVNGGATLDWSASTSEDEKSDRRWSLSIPKRIGKEKPGSSANRQVVEKQDSLYVDKLARIKAKANSHTLRKASIIGEQLERRYTLVYAAVASHGHGASYNPLAVVRWYHKQEPAMQEALDRTEPLTWLKHLLDGRNKKFPRPPWYITALLAEEYVRHHTALSTIPEDAVANNESPASGAYQDTKSPSSSTWSWSASHFGLEPSLSRKRISYDAGLSFEPHTTESGRDSVGAESRASSEGSNKNWRVSLGNGAGSPRSSIYSGRGHVASPTSSRLHLLDLAKRIRRRANDSDDNLSSARNSISEQSHSEDGQPKSKRVRLEDEVAGITMPSLGDPRQDHLDASAAMILTRDSVVPKLEDVDLQFDMNLSTPKPQGLADLSDLRSPSPSRPDFSRRPRISLPTSPDFALVERERYRREEDEEKEREEYDRKAQILEDMISQNYRIRQLLQRVGGSIKEFDIVQSGLSSTLRVPYDNISSEVLDAFMHDPSAVTGSMTSLKGWRAVDSIHERILQQRQILQTFISSMCPDQPSLDIPRNILSDPISALLRSMDDLEAHQSQMVQQAQGVIEALGRVKTIHGEVKKEYNDTLSHTSLVYPELSQIVTLEENWRNHYQQFWDFALDALTLLLDTVTPFWRNYGKVIGQDVQDFLIIPWYRNEFTGEPKRYAIKHFPRRSLRHWLGLYLLSFLSVVILWLQFQTAVSSTLNYRLPWITHAGLRVICIPFFSIAVLMQWCAVLIECAIVFAQGGIIIWWMGWAINVFH